MSIVLQGSTSGSITLQEPAVAGSTVLDLPATSGTLITTGSTGQVIPKAALPTGSVLQVVSATYSTQTSSSSNVYADTGLTASITPSSTSSKILVIANQSGLFKTGGTDRIIQLRLVTGTSTVLALMENEYGSGVSSFAGGSVSICFLHSPSSTSSVTYKTQFASNQNNGTVYVQTSSAVSTITLMEIAA